MNSTFLKELDDIRYKDFPTKLKKALMKVHNTLNTKKP